jgi:hypothetical protein
VRLKKVSFSFFTGTNVPLSSQTFSLPAFEVEDSPFCVCVSQPSTTTTRLFNINTRPSTEFTCSAQVVTISPINGKGNKKRNARNETKRAMAEFDNTQDGHCLVPRRYQEDMSLGAWVSKQRQIHNKNKLGFHRQELLNDIGFVWRVVKYAPARIDRDPQWNKKYQTLVEFKSKNGHCLVPKMYREEDMSLGKWVGNQRQIHSNNKLRLDRKGLLDELEFVWNVEDHQWHLQYENLVEFEQKNGHCLVPKRHGRHVSWDMG